MKDIIILEKAKQLGLNNDIETLKEMFGASDLYELEEQLDSLLAENEENNDEDIDADEDYNESDNIESNETKNNDNKSSQEENLEKKDSDNNSENNEIEHKNNSSDSKSGDETNNSDKQSNVDDSKEGNLDKTKKNNVNDTTQNQPNGKDATISNNGNNKNKFQNPLRKNQNNLKNINNPHSTAINAGKNTVSNIAKNKGTTSKATGEAAKTAGKAIGNGAKVAGKAIGNGAKVAGKAIGSAVMAAGKAIVSFLASNPYVLAILVIIVILGLFVILLLGSGSKVSAGGTQSYNSACDSMSISKTTLTRAEFIEKVSNYFSNSSYSAASTFISNAGTIYDVATNNNINPEVVIVRAISEGFSPGKSYNYWGMGCSNTGGGKDCIKYSSFSDGVLGFVKNISKYDSLSSMMKKYAYIGRYWYNPGSSGLGGCYYYEHIKQFMSSSRSSEVSRICSGSACSSSGGSGCTATTDDDQLAYSKWQVYKMANSRKNIFGIEPDVCNSTENCTIYAQGDSKWANKNLGKSSAKMSDSGCAVTSLAIAISCSNTQINVSNFDAGVFIDKLNAGNCFDSGGAIYWGCSTIKDIAPTLEYQGYTAVAGQTNQQKKDLINGYDLSQYFILLHFQNEKHPRGHFVVYTSTSGDNFVTKDPAGGKITNIAISEIDRLYVYKY